MAIDIVARALAVSGKQNLENYYTKTESDGRYVKKLGSSYPYKVYTTDSAGIDNNIGYSRSPVNSAIAQFTSSGNLQTNSPTADLDAVNKKYGEGNYYRVLGGTNLPENADLNDYTAPATYQVDNDTIGETIKNTPYPYAFKLIVENFSYYTLQRLQGQNPGNLWQRTRQGGAWGNWTQIATTDYVDNKTADLSNKYDKTGGTITGDVTVTGNFTVNGTTTTINSTTLAVKDKLIEVAKDNTVALTTPAGLITPKYDGTNNGGIVYDNTGTAYVGDITLDSNGNVDVANSDLQAIATRDGVGTFTDGHIIKWSNNKLVDGGDLSSNITGTDGIEVTKGSDGNIQVSGKNFVPSNTQISDEQVYTSELNADRTKMVNKTRSIGTYTGICTTNNIPCYYNADRNQTDMPTGVLVTGIPKKDFHTTNKKYVDDNIRAIKSFSVTIYEAGD